MLRVPVVEEVPGGEHADNQKNQFLGHSLNGMGFMESQLTLVRLGGRRLPTEEQRGRGRVAIKRDSIAFSRPPGYNGDVGGNRGSLLGHRGNGGVAGVTRVKELRRIECAIEHLDPKELRWAAKYCQWRIGLVLTKAGRSRSRQAGAVAWRKIEKRVLAAIGQLQEEDSD